MGYLTFFINRIALEADTSAAMDFYNSEEHAGTSYLPFIGFMLFLAGIVVIIVQHILRQNIILTYSLMQEMSE